MGMRKVDPHLRLFREEAVLTHFGFLVVREGAAELNRLCPQFARMSIVLTRWLSRVPKAMRRSITYDNGSENAERLRTNRVLVPVPGSASPTIAGSTVRWRIPSVSSEGSFPRRRTLLRSPRTRFSRLSAGSITGRGNASDSKHQRKSSRPQALHLLVECGCRFFQ